MSQAYMMFTSNKNVQYKGNIYLKKQNNVELFVGENFQHFQKISSLMSDEKFSASLYQRTVH